MIVEGYSLHLYCEGPNCGKTEIQHANAQYVQMTAQFGGRNKKEAWCESRRYGWTKVGRKIFCGYCTPKLSQPQSQV